MKKKISILSLALLLTFLLCTPAFAKTVCKIGSKGYASLQKAVDAVKDGQTIKVTKAIKAKDTVRCTKGVKFTIDFNKKKYTFTGTDKTMMDIEKNTSVTFKNMKIVATNGIMNRGSLTITGGTFEGKEIHNHGVLTIKGGTFTLNSTARMDLLIWNYGKMTMSKGTLKQTKTEDSGRPVMHNGNGEMVISGGKIDSVGGGIHVSGGNVKVTGGSIVLHRINGGRNNPTIWADHGAKVTIKKGTFTVPEDLTVMSASDKSSLTIYGGTFKSGLDVNSHAVRANGEGTEVKIKGGTFDGGVIDCFQSAKMTISGGWSNKIVVAYDNGAITINNFTIDQGSHPWGSMLILENNGKSMVVKGGKYTSKQGVGYQGNVTFETTEDYKKWFDVKELTRK